MLATDPVQPIKIFFCFIMCDIFLSSICDFPFFPPAAHSYKLIFDLLFTGLGLLDLFTESQLLPTLFGH